MLDRIDHHWIDLPDYPESYALLSDSSSVDTAVFFVHGFLGHPIETWFNFQHLIDTLQDAYPWWPNCDLYFYKYPSVFNPVSVSSVEFESFVRSLYPSPPRELFEVPPISRWGLANLDSIVLRESIQYSKLLLAGHSEGAVLLRKFIVDLVRGYAQGMSRNRTPLLPPEQVASLLSNTEMCLFAPAIFGASISGVAGAASRLPILGSIVSGIMDSMPAYKDLSPTSGLLQEIRNATTEFAEQYPHFRGLRARVLWGKKDRVVSIAEYRHDWVAEFLDNHSHTSVCKPTLDYQAPLGFVRHA